MDRRHAVSPVCLSQSVAAAKGRRAGLALTVNSASDAEILDWVEQDAAVGSIQDSHLKRDCPNAVGWPPRASPGWDLRQPDPKCELPLAGDCNIANRYCAEGSAKLTERGGHDRLVMLNVT